MLRNHRPVSARPHTSAAAAPSQMPSRNRGRLGYRNCSCGRYCVPRHWKVIFFIIISPQYQKQMKGACLKN